MFVELFHLHLSGTQAPPEQRLTLVRTLAQSGNPHFLRCASIALKGLLNAHHFSSSSDFDFGARSRDWGWRPLTYGDTWAWYIGAIEFAVELSPVIANARDYLAKSVRDLWHFRACHDALEQAASHFSAERPWIEGWIGFRMAMRFDGNAMPEDVRGRLAKLIDRLKPSDLLSQARAVVLSRGGSWDIIDGEPDDGDVMTPLERASQMAKEMGVALAHDQETRGIFIAELLVEHNTLRAFECGVGLADGAVNLTAMWQELVSSYTAAASNKRNATVLGGFIHSAHARDASFADGALEAAIESPVLATVLPFLQARVAIDAGGIARLRRALMQGVLSAQNFYSIANGSVSEAPPGELGALLLDIAELPDGVEVGLDILHIHFYRDRKDQRPRSSGLIEVGRCLLRRTDFAKETTPRDFEMHQVIRVCCAGSDGAPTLRDICARIRASHESVFLSAHDLSYVLQALFETHPLIALDEFLLPELESRALGLLDGNFGFGTPVEEISADILLQWANVDPDKRFPLLGNAVAMFRRKPGEEEKGISALFLEILLHAPNKKAFLGDIWPRLHPRSWSGPLADILARRRAAISALGDNVGGEVLQWVTESLPKLDLWIEQERTRDRTAEQSFE